MNRVELAISKGLSMEGECKCGERGNREFPCICDDEEAVRMSYITCVECFNAVWAGEN